MAGFGLGICGCVMQAVLKNPLASPFTLVSPPERSSAYL